MFFGWFIFWFIVVMANTFVPHSNEEYVKGRRWRYIGTFMFFAPIVIAYITY